MGLKRNVLYSGFLTTTLYISQLVTYPYVTRVLGATSFGYCNFAQSFVSFFVLIASLGISMLGTREIAKISGNRTELNTRFSQLFFLLAIMTIASLLLYLLVLLFMPQLQAYHKLLWIGLISVMFNLFTIEWFYRGIEDFKYITYRTLIIRMLYIALIFLFVKSEEHYIRYFSLSVVVVILNGTINWIHSRKLVKLVKLPLSQVLSYWKPFVGLGLQLIMLSYYSTVNPILLGLMSNDTEVGYYSIASKLTLIVLLIYNAYTLVLMPRVSSLVGTKRNNEAAILTDKSYIMLYMIAIPLIYIIEIFTPEIIMLVAGGGYEGAIIPMRISVPIILIGGISQISINQVLIPNNLEKGATIASIIGVGICIVFNLIFIPYLESSASAIAWIVTELIIAILTYIYAKRYLNEFSLKLNSLTKYVVAFLPLLGLFLIKKTNWSIMTQIFISCTIFLFYIHVCLKFILQDENYKFIYEKLFKYGKNKDEKL